MKKKGKRFYILFIIILILCVSVGFSFLNASFNINGRSTISKNTWDVYFDNIQVKAGSVVASVEPAVSNKTTISNFKILLAKPGDFYQFYVDVINAGSIDAMIENIIKEPDLTEEQKNI